MTEPYLSTLSPFFPDENGQTLQCYMQQFSVCSAELSSMGMQTEFSSGKSLVRSFCYN